MSHSTLIRYYVFRPEVEEVTGRRRNECNDVILRLYSPPNVIRTIQLRRVKWTERVARFRNYKFIENLGLKPGAEGTDGVSEVCR